MKKKILIPTDFSANAYNAIDYAVKLFEKRSCEFFILNTYYLSGMDRDNLLVPKPTKEARQFIEERATSNMEMLKVRMKSLEANENHNFHFVSQFGQFYELMDAFVTKEAIDLIVMGTKGQSNKNSAILGSNAVNVMEKIRSCPVLAIPVNVKFKAPNEIVFPTSFRNQYKPKELNILEEIAELTGSPIRILHMMKGASLTSSQEDTKKLLENALASATTSYHVLYDIEVSAGVRAFVQSRQSEMIAFINKKHNFFGSIFSNPMVKELGMHAEVPLLAMHDKRE